MASNSKSMVMSAALVVFGLSAGCSPIPFDQKPLDTKTLERRATLAAASQNRTGEPPRVTDPGYQVASCRVVEDSIWQQGWIKGITPYTIGGDQSTSAICENTEKGGQIIAWRAWYCDGERTCVLGPWSNGEPRFGPVRSDTYALVLHGQERYRLSRPRWRQ